MIHGLNCADCAETTRTMSFKFQYTDSERKLTKIPTLMLTQVFVYNTTIEAR